jgi:hypothetical protein
METSYGLNSLIAARYLNGLPDLEVSLNRAKNMKTKDIYSVCKKVFNEKNKKTFICYPKR